MNLRKHNSNSFISTLWTHLPSCFSIIDCFHKSKMKNGKIFQPYFNTRGSLTKLNYELNKLWSLISLCPPSCTHPIFLPAHNSVWSCWIDRRFDRRLDLHWLKSQDCSWCSQWVRCRYENIISLLSPILNAHCLSKLSHKVLSIDVSRCESDDGIVLLLDSVGSADCSSGPPSSEVEIIERPCKNVMH